MGLNTTTTQENPHYRRTHVETKSAMPSEHQILVSTILNMEYAFFTNFFELFLNIQLILSFYLLLTQTYCRLSLKIHKLISLVLINFSAIKHLFIRYKRTHFELKIGKLYERNINFEITRLRAFIQFKYILIS
jgi:hypothetical protein